MSTPASVIDPDQLRRMQASQSLAMQPPPGPVQMPDSGLAIPLPQSKSPVVLNNYGKSAQPLPPRGTIEGDKAERARLEMSGPGESQIYHRVADSQFGQNHPTAAKILGGLGQGLATIGDVGLSAVAPSLAINLPGTAYHHMAAVNGLNRGIGAEEKEGTEEATQGAENARTDLENAQTQQAQEKTKEMPVEAEQHAQLEDAQIMNLLHPQAKTDFEAWRQENPKAPVEDWLQAQANAKPKNMQAKTLQLPNGQQVAGKTDSQGNLLLANGQPAPEGTKLFQQPNYGEMILPTKTITAMVNGVPTIMQWDEKTQAYDKSAGVSATGAAGHEMFQAGAVQRDAESLISDIQANRDKMGTLAAWVEKNGLNTPIADPTLAGLQAELSTFAALQPAMHGFRGGNALETFEKIVGGLQKNPDATIASIRGIAKTAANLSPKVQGTNQGGIGAKVGDVITQGKQKFKVTAVDKDGQPTAADLVK